ncbi:hypothetical protein ACH4FX_37420 [Streptomyces sp. NPDC018019]|uniref:hypothetical protein n=1 Tax=Streptomyces sp. NPDC018019 TaxID=3365030 RepID=UPI0037A5C7C6
MKITVEGADPEFAEKLVALAARHRAELTVIDTAWTAERAERFLRSLPSAARTFARLVVEGGGHVKADALRSAVGKLNGPRVAQIRALPRGVRNGWWPEGMQDPITVVYGEKNPSWQKAIAYEMASENVPVFRAALDRLAATRQAARALGITPGGTDKTTLAWTPDAVAEKAPDVTSVDLDGGSHPPAAPDEEEQQP